MRETRRSDERGFTLLELLVAVTIVSILLAISAQSYYNQRRKGWMAQVKSSVRNMASAQNSHVYVGGALSFASDLDDLWNQGYRYSTDTVIPHVALATSQNFCIQVNSAHDESIVWHFSSEVGYPQEGPATASSCGDLEGAGTYRVSGTGERDGVTSTGIQVADADPGVDGDASKPGAGGDGSTTDPGTSDPGTTTGTTTGATGSTGSTGGASTGKSGTDDGTDTPGSTSGGTTDTASGTAPSGDGGSSGGDGDTTTGGNGNGNGNGNGGGNGHGGNNGECQNGSDPDGDANGGADKPGGSGGTDPSDQDCDNGSGNDADGEDDNKGGKKS